MKTTGIGKGPFGAGCLLKMSSGNRDYELLVSDSGMLLGHLKNGQRIRLWAGGTNTEAQWGMLLQALRNNEARLPV